MLIKSQNRLRLICLFLAQMIMALTSVSSHSPDKQPKDPKETTVATVSS